MINALIWTGVAVVWLHCLPAGYLLGSKLNGGKVYFNWRIYCPWMPVYFRWLDANHPDWWQDRRRARS